MPAAYVRGSINTAPQEAADIVAKGANHGVLAHQGTPAPAAEEQDAVKQKLLQMPQKTSKLAMMGDIATINDIHSAYIHGSVPTAVGESNDIMDLNFPDEVVIALLALLGRGRGTQGAGAGEGREVLWSVFDTSACHHLDVPLQSVDVCCRYSACGDGLTILWT